MFNFIDSNTDARLSYLEFRSWMLMIDQTLAEHEVFQIFTEVDRNRICVCFSSHWNWVFFSFQGDGFIQYKEFRDYFGEDLLTSDANTVDLTSLFNEIDTNHCGSISVDKLLAFFNRYSTMISKEEAEIFLGMISDVGNENRITLKEFLKAMQEWKI